jgi:hypothetical protein
MKKKIIGILVCMLLIVTALSATSATNVQIIQNMKENKDLEPILSTPSISPGIITIKIVAEVIGVQDSHNLLGGAIRVNDTITGKYTYDSLVEDFYPGTPDLSLYIMNFTPCIFELKAGNLVFKTNQTNPDEYNFYIVIRNDYSYNKQDEYVVHSFNNLPLSNGLIVEDIIWYLIDSNGTALADDSLPTTAPQLSKWNFNAIVISGQDPSDPMKTFSITAHVTKATKSRARNVYFFGQPVLIWLLERFPNMFPILRHLMRL